MYWVAGIGVVVGVGVGIGVYLCVVIAAARQQVGKAPKQAMYVCDKHGPLSENATYKLFGGELLDVQSGQMVERKPILACPICFENSMKVATGRAGEAKK